MEERKRDRTGSGAGRGDQSNQKTCSKGRIFSLHRRESAVVSLLLLSFFFLCLPLISVSYAGPARYFYDDAGRLVKASVGEEAVTYEYDEVGNLLAVSGATIKQVPPVIHSITPDVIFKTFTPHPRDIEFRISGENLFTTSSVKFENDMTVETFSATDTTLTVKTTLMPGMELGSTGIAVTTDYGSASIPFNIAKVVMEPVCAGLTIGSSLEEAARIEGLDRDYTVSLINTTPEIISAPNSVTVPAGGAGRFSLAALSEGTGAIRAENSGISVYVGPLFSGQTAASTRAVSVVVRPSLQWPVYTSPVSLQIVPNITGQTISNSVSLTILKNVTMPVVSGPASVLIKQSFAAPAISNVTSVKVAQPVSGPAISQNISVKILKP